ncbi:MAG: hypothetical protein U5N55_12010 [Cypionkella sp.]|nr:hypothetical protein [Cypionkella sp.]
MPWYDHPPTFANPDTGAFSEDFQGIVGNFPSMAAGDVGAPYIQAAWHPYDGVIVGDGNDGVIYDFAVDGSVSTITSPDFVDGAEYAFLQERVSGSAGPSLTYTINFFRETTGTYAGAQTLYESDAPAGSFMLISCHIRAPRVNRKFHTFSDLVGCRNEPSGGMNNATTLPSGGGGSWRLSRRVAENLASAVCHFGHQL